MYICNQCGYLLDELPTVTEKVGEYGNESYYETRAVYDCSCGGEYSEAEKCDQCGNYYPKDDGEQGLCPDCQEDRINRFNARMQEFTPAEKSFLWEAWQL